MDSETRKRILDEAWEAYTGEGDAALAIVAESYGLTLDAVELMMADDYFSNQE